MEIELFGGIINMYKYFNCHLSHNTRTKTLRQWSMNAVKLTPRHAGGCSDESSFCELFPMALTLPPATKRGLPCGSMERLCHLMEGSGVGAW